MRAAVVTGSTSGIGRETATRLAADGYHVVVTGRDDSRGRAVVSGIEEAGGSAEWIPADLRDHVQLVHLAERVVDVCGGDLDLLVNNAGGGGFTPTEQVTRSDYAEVFSLNVEAVIMLTAHLLPALIRRRGSIINVTAAAAEQGVSGMALFASSKGAVVSLTRTWAAELGPLGVRVNSVNPGIILTPINAPAHDYLIELAASQPSGIPGTAADVATAITFLASPDARYVHGVDLPVDGGRGAAYGVVMPTDQTRKLTS